MYGGAEKSVGIFLHRSNDNGIVKGEELSNGAIPGGIPRCMFATTTPNCRQKKKTARKLARGRVLYDVSRRNLEKGF